MQYKVGVITGTRAEYGLLKPLLYRLKEDELIDFQLIVTGSHLSNIFGSTIDEIVEDGFTKYISVEIPTEDDSKEGMAVATGTAIIEFSKLYRNYAPDLLIVLGDRFEIFGAVSAAHLMGIKVAHIAGGDVTEGAVDDAIRHCITKMSYLHFPGCEEAKRRVIQLGEAPERVFNIGEFGVENCINTDFMSRTALADDLDFENIREDYSVVTFHPVTMEENTAMQQLDELIKAMEAIDGMSYIITMANADAGGRDINKRWIGEGEKHSNWKVVSSLGVVRYLSALKYAKLCVGNSSSGLVEAPALGVPTINIGDRQKGRIRPDSVLDCEPYADDIIVKINKGLSDEFQNYARQVDNPFGEGNSSKLALEIIKEYLESDDGNNEKSFYDINY